ncbi:hypothetical protein SLEP1_g28754 [Rubroshorea leprosula]|uniref:Uncharacterized protein n=1 Tax=Rubroshorea leprosula TaxID=152421 RepID=A0AAV5K0S9_9ROSI|nr:hypothetical protein SLEP1_g28754 [Rubroshorea leprosula]
MNFIFQLDLAWVHFKSVVSSNFGSPVSFPSNSRRLPSSPDPVCWPEIRVLIVLSS